MAYIFHQDTLPRLVSVVPGRERTFFVNKELTKTDNLLAGVMNYNENATSPYHFHENCEHFYFIIEGKGSVRTPEGVTPVGPGSMVFFPPEDKHQLRASETGLFYFEFQAPNRFVTTILDEQGNIAPQIVGTPPAELRWEHRDGKVWVQT